MRPKPMSERTRFDPVSIAFHWLTVLLFVPLLGSMYLLQNSSGPDAALLLDIHRGAGASIWTGTVLRFVWRKCFADLPPFPETTGRLDRLTVTLSEHALYLLLVGQTLAGLAMTVARGRAFTLLLWQVPALMPRDRLLAA